MPPILRPILPRLPAVPDQQPHIGPAHQTTGDNALGPKQQRRAVPPIPDLRIDDLGKGPNAWLEAVRQWNVAASPGVAPLKSWQPTWYQGEMSPYFASKRSQRKTIAEEYARSVLSPSAVPNTDNSSRYDSNKDAFLQDYPMAGNIKQLLDAIRKRHQRRRTSCNGTPEERDSQGRAAGPARMTRTVHHRHPAPY